MIGAPLRVDFKKNSAQNSSFELLETDFVRLVRKFHNIAFNIQLVKEPLFKIVGPTSKAQILVFHMQKQN
jgi:hypothetical protein